LLAKLAKKREFGLDIYLSCLLGGLVALMAFVLCGAGFHHPGVHHGEASLGHNGHVSGHHHSLDRSNAASNGGWPSFSILAWIRYCLLRLPGKKMMIPWRLSFAKLCGYRCGQSNPAHNGGTTGRGAIDF
jgi:hypothetical protein